MEAPPSPRNEALVVWAAFLVAVPLLVAADVLFLGERRRGEVSISTASWQCGFWFVTGLAFNAFIWCYLGADEGISWFSGYVLEYMLSVDNLFCFHLIFLTYRTPKDQVHRALVYGIGGAVVLRFALFALGAGMFNLTRFFHWGFGFVLLYSGIKVISISDDAEADHKENWAVRQISRVLPVYEGYAPEAAFLIHAAPAEDTSLEGAAIDIELQAAVACTVPAARECDLRSALSDSSPRDVGQAGAGNCRVKVTLLLLVVITLWAVDLIFALDSVTAKVSMVSQFDNQIDLVLNFTSSAFTMLTLRSLYFLLASLVHIFSLMKYGVGLILVLIGLRLMLSSYVTISEGLFCGVMLGVFAASIATSVAVALLRRAPSATGVSEAPAAGGRSPASAP